MKEAEYLELSDQERDAWVDEFIMGLVMVHGERKYSTDYNAMMRVVEKMESEGYSWEIGYDMNAYRVLFFHMDTRVNYASQTWATNLLNQVYLAAGRALGVIE